MKQYIGTKWVSAEPAWRVTTEDGRAFILEKSSNEDFAGTIEDGYKVVDSYGYESWSPKEVFEQAYRPAVGLNFGLALEAVKRGKRAARYGWNGKGMYIFLAPGESVDFYTHADMSELAAQPQPPEVGDMLVLRTAQANLQPGWLATQSDMLSDDWHILDDELPI